MSKYGRIFTFSPCSSCANCLQIHCKFFVGAWFITFRPIKIHLQIITQIVRKRCVYRCRGVIYHVPPNQKRRYSMCLIIKIWCSERKTSCWACEKIPPLRRFSTIFLRFSAVIHPTIRCFLPFSPRLASIFHHFHHEKEQVRQIENILSLFFFVLFFFIIFARITLQ